MNIIQAEKLVPQSQGDWEKKQSRRPHHRSALETWEQDLWMELTDPYSPVGCKLGPPWIRRVAEHPTDTQSVWDPENLKSRSMPRALRHVPRAIPEQ